MGIPTGILPFNGLLSPFSVAYLLTPAWYAAGLKIALTLFFCMGATYLLLRRLGGGALLSTLGGLAYAFCGVNVVLLHRMSAQLVLPALLFAVLLLVDRPGVRRAIPVGVLVAWTWYEGFPSAFVYCVYVATAWGAWLILRRMWANEGPWRDRLRTGLRPAVWLGGSMAIGFALASLTLLPFLVEVAKSAALGHRQYGAGSHLPTKQLFGVFDLTAIGTYPNGTYWTGGNPVESATNMGLIVTVGLAVSLALGALGRVRLFGRGRDAWLFFAGLGVVATVLVFFGTALLGLAYRIPGIAENPIQRIRFLIVLSGVVVAVLGLSRGSLQGDGSSEDEDSTRLPVSRVVSGGALLFGVVACAVVAPKYVDAARAAGQVRAVAHSLGVEGALALVAVVVILVVVRRPRLAIVGALVLAGLLYGQLAWPLRSFTPAAPVSDFYARKPGHAALGRLLDGRYRFTATGFANFYLNSSQELGLNDVRSGAGALRTPEQQQLMAAALPGAFEADPFKTVPRRERLDVGSPLLDDLAVRYVALGTDEQPFGRPAAEDPTPVAWAAVEQLSSVPVTASGPFQALVLPLRGSGSCQRGSVRVRVHRPDGGVAASVRPVHDLNGTWLPFAVDGQGLAAGDLYRVGIASTTDACKIEAGVTDGPPPRVARRELAPDAAAPVHLVSTDQAWIYERPGAWPVVSSHTRWRAFDHQADALPWALGRERSERDVVAYVGAGRDGGTGGAPAAVSGLRLGDEHIRFRTDGSQPSLIVVSQNGGDGWQATVDGKPTPTVAVDGALLGVFVAPGRHDVRLDYRPWHVTAGLALTGIAVVVCGSALVFDRRRRRRA
jgi:hypothetical protein